MQMHSGWLGLEINERGRRGRRRLGGGGCLCAAVVGGCQGEALCTYEYEILLVCWAGWMPPDCSCTRMGTQLEQTARAEGLAVC